MNVLGEESKEHQLSSAGRRVCHQSTQFQALVSRSAVLLASRIMRVDMLLIMLNCLVIKHDKVAPSYGWHIVDHPDVRPFPIFPVQIYPP